MKTNLSPAGDEPLRATLREWKVSTPLPPRFQEQVWQRIARAETPVSVTPWELFRQWLDSVLLKPALAAAYVAALVFAGLGAGYWQTSDATTRAAEAARAGYVQSVDPFQMPR